jgi:hypothetical protein
MMRMSRVFPCEPFRLRLKFGAEHLAQRGEPTAGGHGLAVIAPRAMLIVDDVGLEQQTRPFSWPDISNDE